MQTLLAEQYENKIGVTFTDRLTGLYNKASKWALTTLSPNLTIKWNFSLEQNL